MESLRWTNEIQWCYVKVRSISLSFVNEKHIRTVTVDNIFDLEVGPSKSEREKDNATDYSNNFIEIRSPL